MSLHTRLRAGNVGFTLIEVLVALGIVAVALGAGVRASGALSRNAERQSQLLLAQLCADNTLVAVRLSKQMPAVGENSSRCEQAGHTMDVTLTVNPTPNPNFLRVQARVSEQDTGLLTLSTVVGRY